VLVVAAGLRAYPWTKPHAFLGVREFDDGVYYGAAKFLLHGLVPYRDFTIVHPPGISLLLLPFAALGEITGDQAAMGCARVAVLCVALANVVLVGRLAQRAGGGSPYAGVLAAALYALSPNALAAEHTVLLEPVVTLLCLLGVRSLLSGRPRGALLCGALVGAGLSVKLFAGAYLLAVMLWLLVRGDRRGARDVLAGCAASTAVLIGPFLLLAPRALWDDVVVTQLSRPVASTAHGLGRILDMAGLSSAPTVLGLCLLLVIAVSALYDVARHGGTGLWLLLATFIVGAFVEAATYFPHYGAFLTPALAVLAARVVVTSPARLRVGTAAVAGLLSFMCVASWHVEDRARGQADLARVESTVGSDRCVFSQSASLAIAADVLQVPRAGCPAMVDQRGVVYATSDRSWSHRKDFYYRGFTQNPDWQHAIVDEMSHADFLLLLRSPAAVAEWSEATKAYALSHFRLQQSYGYPGVPSYELWRRLDGA
jgi:alpha-1,2-mannosyltransferase